MRIVSRLALALCFVLAGITHFIAPATYLAIVPPYVPWPATIVAISGVAAILGGIGICFRPTRFAAGWGLIAFLIAVLPANIFSISTGMVIGGQTLPAWMLWARLPFQLLLVGWVYNVCLSKISDDRRA